MPSRLGSSSRIFTTAPSTFASQLRAVIPASCPNLHALEMAGYSGIAILEKDFTNLVAVIEYPPKGVAILKQMLLSYCRGNSSNILCLRSRGEAQHQVAG